MRRRPDCVTSCLVGATDNTFLLRNIWPTEAMPALEHPFKQLGRLTVDVGTRLAMHCDAYVHRRNPEYARDTLTRVVLGSRTAKVLSLRAPSGKLCE